MPRRERLKRRAARYSAMGLFVLLLARRAALRGRMCQQALVRNVVSAIDARAISAGVDLDARCLDCMQLGDIARHCGIAEIDREIRKRRVTQIRRLARELCVSVFE